MHVLIVKLSAIGDVLHTLPALNAIRKQFSDAHITWLVEEAAADLVVGHQALDRVIVSKRKQWLKGLRGTAWRQHLAEIKAFVRDLRDTEYDLLFDFQALLKSGVLIALTRAKRKIGFDRGMEHMEKSYLFLNERLPPVDMELHALLRNLILLRAVGIDCNEVVYHLPITAEDRARATQLLASHGLETTERLVAINPMTKWPTKLWDNLKFAQLADRLVIDHGARIVFTGSPEDRGAVEEIMAAMQGKAVNITGQTSLKTLAAFYEKIDCLVTTDTGPMHLAAAINKPVVALFGPTAPWRTGPYGDGHQVVRAEMDCSPCYKRTCQTIACMAQISVEQVMAAVARIRH